MSTKLPALARKPTTAPPAKTSRPGAKPGSPPGGAPKTARTSAVLSATGAAQRDETHQREVIDDEERRGQLYITTMLQAQRVEHIDAVLARSAAEQRQMNVMLDDHTRHNIVVEGSFATLQGQIAALKADFSGFVDRTTSTERARLHQLELECNHLRRTLENRTLDLERVEAENAALRDTLARKIARTEQEDEALREEVHHEIKKTQLNWQEFLATLHHQIDTAVLNYHKPQFESSLQSLKESAESVRRKVAAQSERLHIMVDCIVTKETVDAKTMHSNLSALYRKELEKYTKEQLLNLIDVLSFEQGVTAAVGRSIFAVDKSRTQQVFV